MHLIYPGILSECRLEFSAARSLPPNKLLGDEGVPLVGGSQFGKQALWHLVECPAVTQEHWDEIVGDQVVLDELSLPLAP